MTIYRVFYKDDFETDMYFDNYNDAKRNYDEAVADSETKYAKLFSCEFIGGILAPIRTLEHYAKKRK